jgi:CDP-diacylglycerol--glycerol-3-phosphate 3-phosphatidyltransferase
MATMTPRRPPIFNIPNQLTAARLVLAVILFGLIAGGHWVWCVVIFAVAAFTDWLDGYLARIQGQTSALGRNFDPLVDKVLICGAFIFLLPVADAGLAAWMVTLVVARELIITSLRSYLETAGAKFGADWLGKIKMVLQCVVLLYIFMFLKWAEVNSWLAVLRDILIYATLAATALSGLQYVWKAAVMFKAELET